MPTDENSTKKIQQPTKANQKIYELMKSVTHEYFLSFTTPFNVSFLSVTFLFFSFRLPSFHLTSFTFFTCFLFPTQRGLCFGNFFAHLFHFSCHNFFPFLPPCTLR
eukprot:Trichotokara_eunicae@DN5332_c0_g1_i1.p1